VTPQGPVLTLANVDVTNAGNYQLIVTSPYGSVTSAVVSLTVTVPNTPHRSSPAGRASVS
jgi:hypothetical protein